MFFLLNQYRATLKSWNEKNGGGNSAEILAIWLYFACEQFLKNMENWKCSNVKSVSTDSSWRCSYWISSVRQLWYDWARLVSNFKPWEFLSEVLENVFKNHNNDKIRFFKIEVLTVINVFCLLLLIIKMK